MTACGRSRPAEFHWRQPEADIPVPLYYALPNRCPIPYQEMSMRHTVKNIQSMVRVLACVALTVSASSAQERIRNSPTGLVSRCDTNTPALKDLSGLVTCSVRREQTLEDLYKTVATGEHYEFRYLDLLNVTRASTPKNQWMFKVVSGKLVGAAMIETSFFGKLPINKMEIYCGDNSSDTCAKFTEEMLRELPYARPPTFPPSTSQNAVIVTEPRTDVSSCPVAPPCLDPANAQPAYPQEELNSCVQGVVFLLVSTDSNMCVCSAVIEQSSGSRALDLSAITAVRQWKAPKGWKTPDGVSVFRQPIYFKPNKCK